MAKLVWLVLGVCIGVLGNSLLQKAEAAADEKAAYLLVSGSYHEDVNLDAYYAAAQPLAEQVGIEILARSETISKDAVLEGNWNHDGFVVVERFPSMAALREFWYSDEYQAAIPLRQDGLTMNFIVAVEGI